jgi:Ala-tRNA(Pro) deacylase
MAVIPANAHVKIAELNRLLDRKMGLATEVELLPLFSDCELGAIPPIGQAYGIETIVDEGLDGCRDIYFESGNHTDLIHMKGKAFQELMIETRHAPICVH